MTQPHPLVSGLSGHEYYCVNQLGLRPGQLAMGNSVVAMGALRTLTAGLSNLGGGEVTQVTELVHDGRTRAIARMEAEARASGGCGITGVSFEVIDHGTNLEFVAQGSALHPLKRSPSDTDNAATAFYSTSANAQELFCQIDAGFTPRRFVFGNIAYSIGVGGVISGAFSRLKRGEVREYTDIFDHTRHLALARIANEAKACGANAVLSIQTNICPLQATQEMTMVGTAAHHPLLSAYADAPVTSDLTAEEMWNICHLGMVPLQLVMGVSVYSLGFAGGIGSAFRSLVRGEVGPLTELLYEARDASLARVEREAERLGADNVLGVKLRVYDLGGGLVEVMALGTAVKALPGMATRSAQLFPQALVPDRKTFVDSTQDTVQNLGASRATAAPKAQMGVGRIFSVSLIFLYLCLRFLLVWFRH